MISRFSYIKSFKFIFLCGQHSWCGDDSVSRKLFCRSCMTRRGRRLYHKQLILIHEHYSTRLYCPWQKNMHDVLLCTDVIQRLAGCIEKYSIVHPENTKGAYPTCGSIMCQDKIGVLPNKCLTTTHLIQVFA